MLRAICIALSLRDATWLLTQIFLDSVVKTLLPLLLGLFVTLLLQRF
jgi:hypothetical protein